jgi:multiple sugar transport system permease protein
MRESGLMSRMLMSLPANFVAAMMTSNTLLTQMVVYAGVLLAIAPILTIYLFLQRFFVEGLERSGIVG